MNRRWRLKGALLLHKFPALHTAFRKLKGRLADARRGLFSAGRTLPLLSRHLADGYFSVYSALRTKPRTLRGEIVLEDQGRPQVDTQSIAVRCGMNQHGEQPWPIMWSQHDNARLISESLALIDDHNRVCVEAAYSPKWLYADPAYSYFFTEAATELTGNWTSVVSRWVPVIGETNIAHWFFDALPRLALLSDFPPNTKILVPHQLQSFQLDTLKWLGLSDRCRPTPEKNLKIEHYFFSSPVSMIVCYSPYTVRYLRDNILPFRDASQPTPKRFLVQRSGPLRNAVDEPELLGFFRARGWSVVDTATMPLNAQIQLFSEAEAVCGIHGAGLAHVVWCSPGCKVVELFSDKYLSGCYELLCGIIGAEYRSRIFPGDTLYNADVNLTDVENVLQELGL